MAITIYAAAESGGMESGMRLSDLEKYDRITIQCHDNPDADALASGYGVYCYFQSRGKEVRLVYSGANRIHKSNLRLMVDELKLPVEYLSPDDRESLRMEGLLILVDCQYESGNVTRLSADEVAEIDHHQLEREALPMSIIMTNLGSCSTLVWKLLREEDFDIDGNEALSTALYYGLYMDTNQFAELYNPLDMDMRETLRADKSLITLFRNSNLSLKELEIAGIALIRYSYNDDYEFAVIKAQPCDPGILGLISDFLLQVDAIKTCVVFTENGNGYKFSVRSCVKEVNASELAAFLSEGIGSGGGHYEKAGGFISLERYEEKYPTLHTEGYFNNRMTEYFDSYELIYATEYQADVSGMEAYVRRRHPVAYVKADEMLDVGTPITIRTSEGDIDLTVAEDLYIMLGMKGDVMPKRSVRFAECYEEPEECNLRDYLANAEYAPVIKNRKSGRDLPLTSHVKFCVEKQEVRIYARPLEKGVKVFTEWEKNRYKTGKPGDYLAVCADDLHDVYVVPCEQFAESYAPLTFTC